MVECQLPKLDVAGSNPVSRSIKSTCRLLSAPRVNPNKAKRGLDRRKLSLVVGPGTIARPHREQEAGANALV